MPPGQARPRLWHHTQQKMNVLCTTAGKSRAWTTASGYELLNRSAFARFYSSMADIVRDDFSDPSQAALLDLVDTRAPVVGMCVDAAPWATAPSSARVLTHAEFIEALAIELTNGPTRAELMHRLMHDWPPSEMHILPRAATVWG
jgi:hypothetical protein